MIILDSYLLVAQYSHLKLAARLVTYFPIADFYFAIPPNESYIIVFSTINGHVAIMRWAYFHEVYDRLNTSMHSLCYYKEFHTSEGVSTKDSSLHTLA